MKIDHHLNWLLLFNVSRKPLEYLFNMLLCAYILHEAKAIEGVLMLVNPKKYLLITITNNERVGTYVEIK